jgi:hypothetical protein
MGLLTGKVDSGGPQVAVMVMLTRFRVEALKRTGRPFSSPVTILALLDTGASCSAIDPRIIAQLDVEQRGLASVHTPSTGSAYVERPTYDLTLVLGEDQTNPLVVTCQVIASELATQGFLALIGRDVLSRTHFLYRGPDSRFRLTWGPDLADLPPGPPAP